MYALQLRYFYLAFLILSLLAVFSDASSRRSAAATKTAKPLVEDVTEKSAGVADQIALASTHLRARNHYRRDEGYAHDRENDYFNGNLEMNLIRPDSDTPIHAEITAKYTSNVGKKPQNYPFLEEDTETAEEYVAKAMQVYGTRLREPIRIPAETENIPTSSSANVNYDFYEVANKHEQNQQPQQHQQPQAQQTQQQPQQSQPQPAQQLQQQQQHQQQQLHLHQQYEQQQQHYQQQQYQQQEHQQQQQQEHEQAQQQYQPQQHQQQQHQQQQHQQQQHQQQQHQQQQHQQQQQHHQQQHPQQEQNSVLEAHMEAQLQAQIQQAHLLASKQLETQTEEGSAAAGEAVSQQPAPAPAPVYEKDPVTRSYQVYDENAASYEGGEHVDRNYRPKYMYQQVYRDAAIEEDAERAVEEKIRVSASTEIPKAEIMKQIEKSVMKFMKELEAEGKIITSPNQEPKGYYKSQQAPIEEKAITSTTINPKYTTSIPSYHGGYSGGSNSLAHAHLAAGSGSGSSGSPSAERSSSGYVTGSRHHMPKQSSAQAHYQSESDGHHRVPYPSQVAAHHQEMSDALAPNVEFIYKIKTRAPLQTATVKTVSKPYTLPLKGNYGQFDHTAALKNLEDFDLTHVLANQESEDQDSSMVSSTTGKPNQLYFNSDIYHDINSLPYKPEKSREVPAAYRKVKGAEMSGEYNGYSGYFAEPAEKETSSSSSSMSDDGYPIMNPYKYVLKKELLPKYEESSAGSISWEQPRSHSKPHYSAQKAQKALEFDTYSPKFNNNPEGYGYQHTYKSEREQHGNNHKYAGRHPNNNKRGKRGGGTQHPSSKKGGRLAVKDLEANLALRPPPKI